MKAIYLSATAAFTLVMAAIWTASQLSSPQRSSHRRPGYTIDQVEKHADATDCWMAIGGKVHDLTDYVARHPTVTTVIAEWCGREATVAFETKNRGRPHSPHARELLREYEIGSLENDRPGGLEEQTGAASDAGKEYSSSDRVDPREDRETANSTRRRGDRV